MVTQTSSTSSRMEGGSPQASGQASQAADVFLGISAGVKLLQGKTWLAAFPNQPCWNSFSCNQRFIQGGKDLRPSSPTLDPALPCLQVPHPHSNPSRDGVSSPSLGSLLLFPHSVAHHCRVQCPSLSESGRQLSDPQVAFSQVLVRG